MARSASQPILTDLPGRRSVRGRFGRATLGLALGSLLLVTAQAIAEVVPTTDPTPTGWKTWFGDGSIREELIRDPADDLFR